MVYVALLRGINVGGNNKIDMKQLKRKFELVGMNDVVTYINSGNIIFTCEEHSKAEITHMLEAAIADEFNLQIKVLIRSLEDMDFVMQALPENWKNDQQMKSDVMFLWEEADEEESVLAALTIKPEIDTVRYMKGAVLWSCDKQNVTRSGMSRLIGTKLYKQMTVRNVNTTRKIYELMKAVQ